MIISTDFKKHTLKELDEEWNRLDGIYTQMHQQEARLLDYARTHDGVLERENAYSLAKECTERLRTIGFEMQELESYLIENEAPGWTST